MDIFWIARLTILILLHQTSLYEASCVIDETTKVAAAGASNITVVIGAPGESVTFHVNTTDENAVLWCFGDKVIVIVDSNGTSIDGFHDNKYKPHCYVSEKGHALTVAPLRMEDAGKYFAKINGKAYIFTLHVFSKLAELTLTCEAHNCSHGSCHHYLQCSLSGTNLVNSTDLGNVSYSWRAGDQLLAEGPMLLVNKSLLDMRQPLTCTARNAVSSRSVPVANLVMLCAAITTPSTGKLPPLSMSSRAPEYLIHG
ncbi:uncharacterized protein LOC135457599 [Zonotrichia leucophrys gambelii]|uniref:uncharacterized protein LOC135457599 n=1 Tax=Zonotrichia leucophrys gambelii TaxID=257770 RepID=UPI00314020CB